MKCQKCGGKGDVVDSRPQPWGTWRRRQCRVCRERWTTMETAYPSDAALRSLDAALMLSGSGIADARRILKQMLTRGGVA